MNTISLDRTVKEGIKIFTNDEITTTEIISLISDIDKIYNLLLLVYTSKPKKILSAQWVNYELRPFFEDYLSELPEFNVKITRKDDIKLTKLQDLKEGLKHSEFTRSFIDLNAFAGKYPTDYRLNIIRLTRNSPIKIDLFRSRRNYKAN